MNVTAASIPKHLVQKGGGFDTYEVIPITIINHHYDHHTITYYWWIQNLIWQMLIFFFFKYRYCHEQ